MSDTRMTMETSDLSSKTTTMPSATDRYRDETEHFGEMIDLLSGGMHSLTEEQTRLHSESIQQSQTLATSDQVLSVIKASIEESNNNMSAMLSNLTILQQELFTLKQKFEEQQFTSYDGTLIWKITKVQEKMSKTI
jgi:hypothetical protein